MLLAMKSTGAKASIAAEKQPFWQLIDTPTSVCVCPYISGRWIDESARNYLASIRVPGFQDVGALVRENLMAVRSNRAVLLAEYKMLLSSHE